MDDNNGPKKSCANMCMFVQNYIHKNYTNSWGINMSEWKNNPLVVAVITGSAVLTTTLFIVFTYVMPVYQKEDSNKIAQLQKQINEKNELIREVTNNKNDGASKSASDLKTLSAFKNAEINNLKNELVAKNTELASLQRIMNSQKLSVLYQKGSYLPIGYDGVEIGGSRESIYKYYGAPRVITDNKFGFITIKYGYGGIDHIVYYFRDKNGNTSSKANVISHIAVFKESDLTMDEERRKFLKNLSFKEFLVSNLGYSEPCKNYYTWYFPNKGVTVYYDDTEDYKYLIFNSNYSPVGFDESCEKINKS